MKEEKKCRFKSYSVVFDTDSDTTIVVSEFLETDRGSEISIVGDITSEEFLPLAPTSDMVGHPRDNGPENKSPEKEHKKDFHGDSVSQVFPIAIYETIALIKSTPATCNRPESSYTRRYSKIMKKTVLLLTSIILLVDSVSALNTLNYAEYLADKHVIVRQRPIENYALNDRVLRQEVVGIALRLTG